MFTWVVDVLLLGAVLQPPVTYFSARAGVRGVTPLFCTAVLGIAMALFYPLYGEVSRGIVLIPIGATVIGSALEVDGLSLFIGLVAVLLGLLSAVFSIRYMEHDTGLGAYYTLIVLMTAGMVGIAFAGDLFTLYLFWEITSVTSYALVAFRKDHWEAVEAGFKYLIMSASGSAMLLLAFGLLYGMTGTLNLAGMAYVMKGQTLAGSPWLWLAFLFLIVGFGVKAAIVPLHTWLPDAHPAAPSPVSALLSGIVIETAVYAFSRVLFTVVSPAALSWEMLIAVLSLVTMTTGNIMALLQSDVKRLLAYSSIAQVGYILVGLAAGTRMALTGAVLHILNHALMKGSAFLCAGAFIHSVGSRDVSELKGIGRRMPLSTIAFTLSLFALAGTPPLNGFISKVLLFAGAFEAGFSWLAIAGVLNSVLSLAYYLRLMLAFINPKLSQRAREAKEAPASMLAPIAVMSVLIVVFGVWPDPVIGFSEQAAAALVNIEAYTSAVMGKP